MNKDKIVRNSVFKTLLLSGLFIFSGLFWGCSDDDPVVNNGGKPDGGDKTEKPYSVSLVSTKD